MQSGLSRFTEMTSCRPSISIVKCFSIHKRILNGPLYGCWRDFLTPSCLIKTWVLDCNAESMCEYGFQLTRGGTGWRLFMRDLKVWT